MLQLATDIYSNLNKKSKASIQLLSQYTDKCLERNKAFHYESAYYNTKTLQSVSPQLMYFVNKVSLLNSLYVWCIRLISLLFQLFLLEELRERKYDGFARKIQKAWRRYKSEQYFYELKKKGKNIFILNAHDFREESVVLYP